MSLCVQVLLYENNYVIEMEFDIKQSTPLAVLGLLVAKEIKKHIPEKSFEVLNSKAYGKAFSMDVIQDFEMSPHILGRLGADFYQGHLNLVGVKTIEKTKLCKETGKVCHRT